MVVTIVDAVSRLAVVRQGHVHGHTGTCGGWWAGRPNKEKKVKQALSAAVPRRIQPHPGD